MQLGCKDLILDLVRFVLTGTLLPYKVSLGPNLESRIPGHQFRAGWPQGIALLEL
jgi:hypothetical protein